MENFLFTVNAVLPLFVIIAAGWLCRRKRLIVEDNTVLSTGSVSGSFFPASDFPRVIPPP